MKKQLYHLGAAQRVAVADGAEIVRKFKEECCTERNGRGEGGARSVDLYLAFLQWCNEQALPGLSYWRWAQHFSRLVARLTNRVGGTRYRCTNDYGGLSYAQLNLEHSGDFGSEAKPSGRGASLDEIAEQWAREQGIWLLDHTPGWQVMNGEWRRAAQFDGRLLSPPARLVWLGLETTPLQAGELVEIPNGAPALEVLLQALAAFGVKVTVAPVSAGSDHHNERRTTP